MRNAVNIKVKESIIHILDPRGMGRVLSTIALPTEENQSLMQYFTRHIQSSLKDPATQAARFRNINPEQPTGFCEGILSKRLNLVEGSQELAKSLYKILEADGRISAADLAVCLFTAENYPSKEFLALLKIDPSPVFRHVVLTDQKGNTYVNFEPDPLAFTNERLQKSAFIHSLKPRDPDYDLLLLDRQVRGQEEDLLIARFFSERFLDAELAYDPREHTNKLYKSLLFAQKQLAPEMSLRQDDQLDRSIRILMSSSRVNLDDWVEKLSLPKRIREQIDGILKEKLADREFDLDPEFSAHLIQKAKFAGDFGLKVEVDAKHLKDVITIEQVIDDPERQPYYRITINTDVWKRVY